jgi:two-component system, NarL family, response regulator
LDNKGAICILLVYDVAVVRDGLKAILNRQPDMHVISEAGNGVEAIEQFRLHQPDVTLMDVSMPQMDGIRATETILSEYPTACILVMSSIGDTEARSLQAGAKAYLQKDSPREYWLETIRALYYIFSYEPHHEVPTVREHKRV